MAVCGCCWLCGRKLVCRAGQGCADCDRPALVREDESDRVICGECVKLVKSGSVAALIEALRTANKEPTP